MEKDRKKFWVYVLENPSGSFYIGQTGNLEKRVSEHNDPVVKSKYTAKHGPWKLIWSKSFPNRSMAVSAEKQIKKMKSAQWIRRTLLGEGIEV